MDKNTLSNYGWIVIAVLVLSVMIAMATPFGQFIANGFESTYVGFDHTSDGALSNVLDDMGIVPTTDQLQSKYKFDYYSTMLLAVNDVNNNTIGENADTDKGNAVAGIFTDDNGVPNVVLLKDHETTRIQPNADMVINLGGKTLSTTAGTPVIDSLGGTLIIDGRLKGSAINSNGNPLQFRAGTVDVLGGTYTAKSDKTSNTIGIMAQCNLTIKDITIDVTNVSGGAQGIQTKQSSTLSVDGVKILCQGTKATGLVINDKAHISNTKIELDSTSGLAQGIEKKGNLLSIADTKILCYGVSASGILTSGEAHVSNTQIEATATNGTVWGIQNGTDSIAGTATCSNVIVDVSSPTLAQGIRNANGTLNLSNSKINAFSNGSAWGVADITTNTKNISDCKIFAESDGANIANQDISVYGIVTTGTIVISNTTATATGPYFDAGTRNSIDDNSGYDSCVVGIMAFDTSNVTLINNNVKGMHSGVSVRGDLYVNGGTYEGYSHGGFYISGNNKTSHIKNAITRQCEKYNSYEDDGSMKAGMYIGGNSSANNITVYMDNCDIYGKEQGIVLRGGSGEINNSLYISNSKMNDSYWDIRVDDITHRVYLGAGNNFTKENVTPSATHGGLSPSDRDTIVVITNDIYCK